ncbi:MAG: molybdate ABC transporter substrate-binding protein [Pseudomonadota bacterium]
MGILRLLKALVLATTFTPGLLVGSSHAGSVTVFAAASLKEALDKIVNRFEAETDAEVILSFAGSSTLARQIEFGAPADVFISASTDWMDHLEARNLIDAKTRFNVVSNRLALVGPAGARESEELPETLARLGNGKLAMALTNAVPAGVYGKAALEHLDLWDSVSAQVAETDNVRAALALVALGAAPLGVVYATDAQAENGVSLLGLFPEESHPEISYPAARVAASQSTAADIFLDYLNSEAAQDVLAQYGFVLVAQ